MKNIELSGLSEYVVCVIVTAPASEHDFDELLLGIDEFGMSVVSTTEGGDIIKQQYDYGEYETGYFASAYNDWDNWVDYSNTEYLIERYNKALKAF